MGERNKVKKSWHENLIVGILAHRNGVIIALQYILTGTIMLEQELIWLGCVWKTIYMS